MSAITGVWKLVPVEPTPAMIKAGTGWGTARSTWAPMIEAAPQPPVSHALNLLQEMWDCLAKFEQGNGKAPTAYDMRLWSSALSVVEAAVAAHQPTKPQAMTYEWMKEAIAKDQTFAPPQWQGFGIDLSAEAMAEIERLAKVPAVVQVLKDQPLCTWPAVFAAGEFDDARPLLAYVADALEAWALCMSGFNSRRPPKFDFVMVSIALRTGISGTPESFSAWANENSSNQETWGGK